MNRKEIPTTEIAVTKTVILVNGLPGSGKTTMSKLLAERLSAVHVNTDYVRDNINRDLGFSEDDRVEHARRMAHIAQVSLSGFSHIAVVDFVCPTRETRLAFLEEFDSSMYDIKIVYMDTISESRLSDTNLIFQKPTDGFDGYRGVTFQSYLQSDLEFTDSAASVAEYFFGPLKWNIIRFNTECNSDPSIPRKWRLIGPETHEETHKVESFKILRSPTVPLRTYENGVEKWNIAVYARAHFTDLEGRNVVFI